MVYKPEIAVYDACVLYPFHLRNLLVQCGVDRLVDVRWTDAIHEEWSRNLVANNTDIAPDRLVRTRDLMKRVLPEANVTDYEKHIPEITLPDPDDRHVAAAAISARASCIVTWNLKDFPAPVLTPLGVTAIDPDAFLMDLYARAPAAMIAAAANARKNLTVTVPSTADFIAALEDQKLTRFGNVLRAQIKKL